MPSAITPGTCAKFDASTVYGLNDTRDGAGTTIIPVALADLIQSPHELHIDAAGDNLQVVACGDVK
jgi:hypothetical protein